jgi:hypothetical protein
MISSLSNRSQYSSLTDSHHDFFPVESLAIQQSYRLYLP